MILYIHLAVSLFLSRTTRRIHDEIKNTITNITIRGPKTIKTPSNSNDIILIMHNIKYAKKRISPRILKANAIFVILNSSLLLNSIFYINLPLSGISSLFSFVNSSEDEATIFAKLTIKPTIKKPIPKT